MAFPTILTTALDALTQGNLVAFPTETVYGLGADATNTEAVAKIYAAKGRPAHNPLIIHGHSIDHLKNFCVWNEQAEKLGAAFMPGPLTLVLPLKAGATISPLATANLPTVAVRLPSHPLAQQLLQAFGRPVAAPSANPSGMLSATRAAHVRATLAQKVSVVLDDPHPCDIGLESTIVDVSLPQGWRLLRAGAITAEQLVQTLGTEPLSATAEIKSPGQLLQHYAPHTPLRLNATTVQPEEALLAFGTPLPLPCNAMLNLSPSQNLLEAAANLFDFLHELDALRPAAIAVMPIPLQGIGIAINDRLIRGATQ